MTFINYKEATYHNNFSEYIIRKGILKRKVSGGSKSLAGAKAYACLQTIAQTCQLRDISFHKYLKIAMIQYIRNGKVMLLSEYEKQFFSQKKVA